MGKSRQSANLVSDNNIFVDIVNDRVGIGTTNPVGQLQVSSGPVIVGSASSTGTASQTLQVTGGGYFSGSVGIGTTNPTKPLHIYTADGDIRIGDITEGTASTDAGVIFTGLGSNTSALFTEVNGTILSYGINCGQITGIETARIGGIFRLDTRTSGPYGDSNCFVVKGRSIGTTTEYNALVVGLNDGNTYLSPTRGNVLVGSSSSTGTGSQPLQVTGGGYVSGNLGIGHTLPTSKLEVNGDVSIASTTGIGTVFDIIPYDTLNSGTLSFETNIGQLFSLSNNLTSGSIFAVNDISSIPCIDVDASGSVQLAPYLGNVGVGTTNPQSKLSVFGGVSVTGVVTATTINDSNGNVRGVPQNSKTSSYTLVSSDAGKHISITTGGVTIPAFTFNVGDAISIFNNSEASQRINQGSNVTLRQAATTSTGSRNLSAYGICTVLCISSNVFVISGAGLS